MNVFGLTRADGRNLLVVAGIVGAVTAVTTVGAPAVQIASGVLAGAHKWRRLHRVDGAHQPLQTGPLVATSALPRSLRSAPHPLPEVTIS